MKTTTNITTKQQEQEEQKYYCSSENKLEKSTAKKLFRRVKQALKKDHVFIRFDTMAGLWAILDPLTVADPQAPLKLVRHFEYGYMENVKFSVRRATSAELCLYGQWVGIAEGDLIENSYGPSGAEANLGYRNLEFKGERGFLNPDGESILKASGLRIMSERRAMYKD